MFSAITPYLCRYIDACLVIESVVALQMKERDHKPLASRSMYGVVEHSPIHMEVSHPSVWVQRVVDSLDSARVISTRGCPEKVLRAVESRLNVLLRQLALLEGVVGVELERRCCCCRGRGTGTGCGGGPRGGVGGHPGRGRGSGRGGSDEG